MPGIEWYEWRIGILNGKRDIRKPGIRILARHFGVDPGVFI